MSHLGIAVQQYWAPSRELLGHVWDIWRGIWGPLQGTFKPSGAMLEPSRSFWRRFWDLFGAFLGRLIKTSVAQCLTMLSANLRGILEFLFFFQLCTRSPRRQQKQSRYGNVCPRRCALPQDCQRDAISPKRPPGLPLETWKRPRRVLRLLQHVPKTAQGRPKNSPKELRGGPERAQTH